MSITVKLMMTDFQLGSYSEKLLDGHKYAIQIESLFGKIQSTVNIRRQNCTRNISLIIWDI